MRTVDLQCKSRGNKSRVGHGTLDAIENLMEFSGGITTSEYLTNLGTLDGGLPKWDWI